MFNKKKIEELTNQIDTFREKQFEYVHKTTIVECETCGCLLFKNRAFKGKSVIVDYNPTPPIIPAVFIPSLTKEYVKETYYCKLHKPHKPKPKTKNQKNKEMMDKIRGK